MQKAVFALPIVALAVVIAAFLMTQRREAGPEARASGRTSGAGDASSESAAVIAKLREELETARKSEAAQRQRAEAAELKLAEAAAASTAPAGPPPATKTAANAGDWKRRRGAGLEAKVKSMEWRQHARSMIEFWKAREKARADGRALQFTPELQVALSALQAEMTELYKFMGLEGGNAQAVFQNEVVAEAYMDAFLQELTDGTLSESQLGRLRATGLYRAGGEEWDFTTGNILEGWKELVEHNRNYTTFAADIVTPDQLNRLSKAVTPTFMLSVYGGYSEKPIDASGAPAAPLVADYWMRSFNLPEDQRAAVDAAAADYVRRQAEIAAQFGGARTRDADFDCLLKLIEAQLAAERRIADTVQVDPELARKLLKGSGAILKLSN